MAGQRLAKLKKYKYQSYAYVRFHLTKILMRPFTCAYVASETSKSSIFKLLITTLFA